MTSKGVTDDVTRDSHDGVWLKRNTENIPLRSMMFILVGKMGRGLKGFPHLVEASTPLSPLGKRYQFCFSLYNPRGSVLFPLPCWLMWQRWMCMRVNTILDNYLLSLFTENKLFFYTKINIQKIYWVPKGVRWKTGAFFRNRIATTHSFIRGELKQLIVNAIVLEDLKRCRDRTLPSRRLAFQAFMLQEKPFGYRVLDRTMKVLLRHPGLMRFSSWWGRRLFV